MAVIVPQESIDTLDLESIGIKGAALRHLRSLRLYVPRFMVVTGTFFERLADESGLAQKARFAQEEFKDPAHLSAEFLRLLDQVSFSENQRSELENLLSSFRQQGRPRVVVRSSKPYMSVVDSQVHLNLTSVDELAAALMSVYREHFSERSIEERADKGLPAFHTQIPIIVQKFVTPDTTGIIMPYHEGHPNFHYITAWRGFGHELDFATCDHYLVNYKDLMLERFLNNSSGEVVFFEEESGSIARTKILREEAEQPFLDHDQIIELCKIYSENAADLGGLSLEFAIRGNEVFFVSLKDSKILLAAEQALEKLRENAGSEASESAAVQPEPSAPEPVQSEPQVAEPEAAPAPEAPEPQVSAGDALAAQEFAERASFEPQPEPVAAPEPVPEPAPEPMPERIAPEQPEMPAAPEPSVEQPQTPTPQPAIEPQVAPEPAIEPEAAQPASEPRMQESGVTIDLAREAIDRVIAKYARINPSLAEQLSLLGEDIVRELDRIGEADRR